MVEGEKKKGQPEGDGVNDLYRVRTKRRETKGNSAKRRREKKNDKKSSIR